MATLAQFKRTIRTGMEITCTKMERRLYSEKTEKTGEFWTPAYQGEFFDVPIPEKLSGARYVSHVDTTGFYLKRPEHKSERGSFCGWPKAAELAFDGDTFTITDMYRDNPYQRRHYKITTY